MEESTLEGPSGRMDMAGRKRCRGAQSRSAG